MCVSCGPTVSVVAYCVLSLRHLFSVLIYWHQETKMPPHFTLKIHWSIRRFTDSRFTLVICGICCFATRYKTAEHKGWRWYSWADGDSSSCFPLSCFTLQLRKIILFCPEDRLFVHNNTETLWSPWYKLPILFVETVEQVSVVEFFMDSVLEQIKLASCR